MSLISALMITVTLALHAQTVSKWFTGTINASENLADTALFNTTGNDLKGKAV